LIVTFVGLIHGAGQQKAQNPRQTSSKYRFSFGSFLLTQKKRTASVDLRHGAGLWQEPNLQQPSKK
jgi:hypothetical protein